MSERFIADLGYSNDLSCLYGKTIVAVRLCIDEQSLFQGFVIEFSDGSKVQFQCKDVLNAKGMIGAWWTQAYEKAQSAAAD